jgi:hypothetical protein
LKKHGCKKKISLAALQSLAKTCEASDSLGKIQLKLKNVKNHLKGWGANLRGRYIKRKKRLVGILRI